MKEVTDFSKYTEAELRKILIDNATPIASGMDRVVREITKKYNACDREMLLWFIDQPPYNGKLWVSNPQRILTAEEHAREERRRAMEIEKAQKKRMQRPEVVKEPVIAPRYEIPAWTESYKKKSIITLFKELGCKPVMIAEKTVGIVKMGSYAEIDRIKAAFPDWRVVDV
jgi:hypothetical protein